VSRNWSNLSDYEFEQLVGDLLGADLAVRFERFTRGPDGGIDLRYTPPGRRRPHVVQVKHYSRSRYTDLHAAVTREACRLRAHKVSVASYRLVTSLGLTPANKRGLATLLHPWVESEDHILGRDDVEPLLDAHPEVERRHVKLWLGSSTQLASFVQAGTHARSRVLAQDIVRTLPLYVQGDSFQEAVERLEDAHALLIAGEPGIGKTTLARMLVGVLINDGYEPIEVSHDINEAWETWDAEVPQVFLYDDFLGRTMLGELSKNEDSRLLSFMREVEAAPRSRLILTTREYILKEAARSLEAFRRHGLTTMRFLLTLGSYSPLERARILHNHVWHSDLPLQAREELAIDRAYRRIVRHSNFNPRLIEYITGLQTGHPVSLAPGESWLDFAGAALDHPDEIWRQAFERELGDDERSLLLCLVTMPDEAEIGDLEQAFLSWMEHVGRPVGSNQFESALKIVDDSFTQTRRREGNILFCAVSNPGLADFLSRQLASQPYLLTLAARSAVFFEQIERLWRTVELGSRSTVRAVLASSELSAAVHRLFLEPGARWARVAYSHRADRYERINRSADERLAWLLNVAEGREIPTGMRETTSDILTGRIDDWTHLKGDSGAAEQVARALTSENAPETPDHWSQALVDMAIENAWTIADWDSVAALIDILPGQFTDEVREFAVDRFHAFASDELDRYGDDAGSEDEISALGYLADVLGTELNDEDVDRARERMAERLSREDYLEDNRRDWSSSGGLSSANDAAEMDALFSRLIE
jgi:energy-coupling factor transporter ATP-binding protein EcfA2